MPRDTAGELRGNLRAEWSKTWSLWAPAAWLLWTVLICMITATSLANDFVHGIFIGESAMGARMAVLDALGPAVCFAQIAIAGFAIQLVSPEYSTRAITATFLAQPRRWIVLVAKAVTAAAIAASLGAFLGPVSGQTAEMVLGASAGDRVPGVAASIGVAAIFAAAAVAGVALAFLLRSAVAALCVSFALFIVTLVAPGAAARWLPGPAGASFLEGLVAGSIRVQEMGVLVGWCLALLAGAVWLVRRGDA